LTPSLRNIIFAVAAILLLISSVSCDKVLGGEDISDRNIRVYLPPSYNSSPSRRYPVVYLLDGDQWSIDNLLNNYMKNGTLMRQVINKLIREEDLYGAVGSAYSQGWRRMKLYFLTGLPSETEDDVREIFRLALTRKGYQVAQFGDGAEALEAAAEQQAKAQAEQQAAAEEKARQEADARVAKLKAKEEAKAEAARLKAEQEAKDQAEKQALAETRAEAARQKAEQAAKAETEKQAAAEAKKASAAEPEAAQLKAEQEAQATVARADAEKKAKTEELAAAEAESARVSAEKKAQADAQAAAEAKATKLIAAKSDMLVDFAQEAVLKNPDVLSRWHNFQAAVSEVSAAQGGYFPRVDMTVGGGLERSQSPTNNYAVNTQNTSLTLTQILYDGFATRNEVRRLNNAQLARYYELLDVSETAALEAVRVFYDVSRQRKLFELTEDNYVRHRTAFEQIKLKVQAGVGRRVDLEQAAARLALSESSLEVDNANIHDVSARFQRVVGNLPPRNMLKSSSQGKLAGQVLPNAADAIISAAIDHHPAILAAVENVRSVRHGLDGQRAKFQPTVNLSVAQTHSVNPGGMAGATNNASANVTLNWNLYSGGSDSARSGQSARQLDAARDLRDKACRDVRMILEIAYNDISKLKAQLSYLDQHQLSIEKALAAYQKQFEIGQRSLLDLLDTESELYQAKRSYVNAEYDMAIAQARTIAGMGQLVSSLGIARLETADLPELLGTSSDAAENCPPVAPMADNIRKAELDARAIEKAKALIDASRMKDEEAAKKKAKEDEEFLMTPGETKGTKLQAGQDAKVVDAEPARLKAEQEAQAAAEEKARQEAEAKVAKLKAKEDAKIEAARLKAEQKAKAQADAQAKREAKAEAARLKAEQQAQAQAEKQAAAEANQAAKAEAARVKVEQAAQAAEVEPVRLDVEQETQAAEEEKARQEADVRVAKLKAKIEAKAKTARVKTGQ